MKLPTLPFPPGTETECETGRDRQRLFDGDRSRGQEAETDAVGQR